jgi:hypothetical protein
MNTNTGIDTEIPKEQDIHSLKPEAPFVWPDARVLDGTVDYEHQPPFEELVNNARLVYGTISALTEKGIDVINSWLNNKYRLEVSLILYVYPACATQSADLERLLGMVKMFKERLKVKVHPLSQVTDHGSNALCFMSSDTKAFHIVTGPSEDLGLQNCRGGHVNFVFRAEQMLITFFNSYFNWVSAHSRYIYEEGVTQIPLLFIGNGDEEGARLWRNYRSNFDDSLKIVYVVDADTGSIKIQTADGKNVESATEELGIREPNPLATKIARLYDKGSLVSIDKLGRIPPLDAPLSPSFFGDEAEMQSGNITRSVSMRVSIIDEDTLKAIKKQQQSMRSLLNKFSYGLADNMRWMPDTARPLFESEVARINNEGQQIIQRLLKGDVAAFIESRREQLSNSINEMYKKLGKTGTVTKDKVDKVIESLHVRLDKAKSADFMPMVSYSRVIPDLSESSGASMWGQAFSLLQDIAIFSRKAVTDRFFFCGIKIDENDFIEAMDIAEDSIWRDQQQREVKTRCNKELELLSRIEKSNIPPQKRCELVWQLIAGVTKDIEVELDKQVI